MHVIVATGHGVLAKRVPRKRQTHIILYAVDTAKAGFVITVYSQDIDVFLLALPCVSELGAETAMIMDTSDRHPILMLQLIFSRKGQEKVTAVVKLHSLTGCGTSDWIYGKSKEITIQDIFRSQIRCCYGNLHVVCWEESSEDVIENCK